MKKLLFTQALIITAVFTAFAQNPDEQALLKFISDYDKAYMNNEIAFVERNLAEDYVLVVDGERKTRPELFAEIRKEMAGTINLARDLRSKNETLRVVGDLAVATGMIEWKETPKVNPRNDMNAGQERYTLVFERRGGRWLLLSEHISSIRRDRTAMEAEVRKASADYSEMIRRRDAAAIERVLSSEYILTTENGQNRNKAQELDRVKNSPYKIESLTMSEQKIRVYSGTFAVETGTVNYKGADKDGKPHAGIERYTTVWIRREGRWQIISDHLSDLKE